MSACSRCNAGPSDAAREKAILKRQRKAGLVLAGRAAKNKRRSELVARGVTDADILDEMTTSVGLSGVPFVVDVASRKGKLPTSTLPVGYELRQVIGEQEACDALLRYHSSMCHGSPDTQIGRDYALSRGWAAPQQALALAGHHPGFPTSKCNVLISIELKANADSTTEPVAVLAMHLKANARYCSVLVIHVPPQQRGLQLPALLWDGAKACINKIARNFHRAAVKFTLAIPCCQSQQGAHFWIHRMHWDGTDEAKEAAKQWNQGVKWKVGTFELWYDMPVV